MATNWTRASEAEAAIRRELTEQSPDRARALEMMTCEQLQAEYDQLYREVELCWNAPDRNKFGCIILGQQLGKIRSQMVAAGCPIPPGE